MDLIEAARNARERAYAPYSNFKVGAAIRSVSGAVYCGVNVENAAYSETICAEAAAIAAMILDGETRIAEAAIIGDCPDPLTPCGGCRQKLAEFSALDVVVTMANMAGKRATMTVGDLLPGAFDRTQMDR